MSANHRIVGMIGHLRREEDQREIPLCVKDSPTIDMALIWICRRGMTDKEKDEERES